MAAAQTAQVASEPSVAGVVLLSGRKRTRNKTVLAAAQTVRDAFEPSVAGDVSRVAAGGQHNKIVIVVA